MCLLVYMYRQGRPKLHRRSQKVVFSAEKMTSEQKSQELLAIVMDFRAALDFDKVEKDITDILKHYNKIYM
jgi:hypothetical protein